jgi:hypothetical protein
LGDQRPQQRSQAQRAVQKIYGIEVRFAHNTAVCDGVHTTREGETSSASAETFAVV